MKALRRLLGQEGTSTLEFIVVLPTLLFIMFAAVELSRAWLTAHVATSAVREGVRLAAVTPVGKRPISAATKPDQPGAARRRTSLPSARRR